MAAAQAIEAKFVGSDKCETFGHTLGQVNLTLVDIVDTLAQLAGT